MGFGCNGGEGGEAAFGADLGEDIDDGVLGIFRGVGELGDESGFGDGAEGDEGALCVEGAVGIEELGEGGGSIGIAGSLAEGVDGVVAGEVVGVVGEGEEGGESVLAGPDGESGNGGARRTEGSGSWRRAVTALAISSRSFSGGAAGEVLEGLFAAVVIPGSEVGEVAFVEGGGGGDGDFGEKRRGKFFWDRHGPRCSGRRC